MSNINYHGNDVRIMKVLGFDVVKKRTIKLVFCNKL
jgi:hypothetical protein